MSQLKDERVFDVPTDVVAKLTASDRRLIRELTVKLAAAHDDALPPPAPAPPDDLRPFIDPWVSFMLYEGKTANTIRTYTHHTRTLLRLHPSPTPQQLEQFVAFHDGAPIASCTVHVKISAVKSFFQYLAHSGALPANLSATIQRPRRSWRERKPPDPAHIAQILASPRVSRRYKTMILLLADCGLRITEALTLQLSHVDFDKSTVTVFGKGSKERTVPFSDPTRSALLRHIKRLPRGTPWLFPSRKWSRHTTPNTAESAFRDICDRLGIPRFSPHQLRHYFATSMLNDHANLRIVSQLLGHAHPSTTANIYWHAVDADEGRKEHRRHNPLRAVLRGMADKEDVTRDTPSLD